MSIASQAGSGDRSGRDRIGNDAETASFLSASAGCRIEAGKPVIGLYLGQRTPNAPRTLAAKEGAGLRGEFLHRRVGIAAQFAAGCGRNTQVRARAAAELKTLGVQP